MSSFATIQVSKKDVAHSEERKQRSVVEELTVYKRKKGKGGCSNGSAHNWLKQFRPKVAICPHKLDYCDTCAKQSEDLRSKQTIVQPRLSGPRLSGTSIIRTSQRPKNTLPRMRRRCDR